MTYHLQVWLMYYLSLLNTKLEWNLQRKKGDKEMQHEKTLNNHFEPAHRKRNMLHSCKIQHYYVTFHKRKELIIKQTRFILDNLLKFIKQNFNK